MNSQQFREAAHQAVEEIINYYDTIEERRVLSNVEPGYLAKLVPSGPPQEGEKWEDIQKDIEGQIMPGLTHWQSPNFMAFFPANTTYPSMLGELYSAAFTAPAFNWQCSPAVTELETIVLDWLVNMLSLPRAFLSAGTGGGVIQGSASESLVTIMIAARERYLRHACGSLTGEARTSKMNYLWSRMAALGSDQTHSSTAKAAKILGVKYIEIPTDPSTALALTGPAYAAALAQCHAAGLEPFHLTATLGTTATCASDDFGAILAINTDPAENPYAANPPWIHIDAAYAGAALILPEYAHLPATFAAADSFDMNMHKWLLTNFDASCLFVRDRSHLTTALSITPSYLQNAHTDSGLVTDYRDWQIPLGRRFRALKVWFVIRSYGVVGMQAHVRGHIELNGKFASWIRQRGDLFEMPFPPAFALTSFALRKGNEATRKVVERVNGGGWFVTSSLVKGVLVLRVVMGAERGEERHLRGLFEGVVGFAEEVVGGGKGKGLEGVVNGVGGKGEVGEMVYREGVHREGAKVVNGEGQNGEGGNMAIGDRIKKEEPKVVNGV